MPIKSLRFTLPLCLIALVACKKQDEPAKTAAYQAGEPGAAGAPAVAVASAPPGSTAAPSATAPSSAASANPDPSLAAALTPMLGELAKKSTVAGAKAIGVPFLGNVGAAQTLEQQIMLQPNKCYSVVAIGLPPISELNVQFVAVAIVPGMAPVLAVDQDTGPSAVLGKKPNCYKWALPLPVSVRAVVSAAGGQGLAAAQIFEK
jgi:hypothetical protein